MRSIFLVLHDVNQAADMNAHDPTRRHTIPHKTKTNTPNADLPTELQYRTSTLHGRLVGPRMEDMLDAAGSPARAAL